MKGTAGGSTADRLTAGDLVVLRTDVGPVPMHIGAVLLLERGARARDVERILGRRLAAVPRLRQVVVSPPWRRGRAIWEDDPAFDVAHHVTTVVCPAPGDLTSILEVAAEVLTRRLTPSRPMWRAVVVRSGGDEAIAVVIVVHHVLADGLGGLALLARIIDEEARSEKPQTGALGAEPTRTPLGRTPLGRAPLGRAPLSRAPLGRTTLSRARRGWTELGHSRPRFAPRTSFNRPTGPRRALRAVTVELAPLRAAARRHHVTVNDLLLVATAHAMGHVLRRRGEVATDLVISVPVSGRARGDEDLGNRVGVMPIRVPLTGSLTERLHEVAGRTSAQKSRTRGDSAALIGPAFRLLAACGAFRWFINRQRLVNSFVTNVPGPPRAQSLCGAPVMRVVPMSTTPGNVAVSFTALSYAGELAVTVTADPDVVTEVDLLADALEAGLRLLVADNGT